MLAVIIMGSPGDRPFCAQIAGALDKFGIPWEMRVASAHKTPTYLLELLAQYEADPRPKVYITVAGRSNALSGMVDAQVAAPVIACPPYGDKFAGADVYSSLRAPSGVAPARGAGAGKRGAPGRQDAGAGRLVSARQSATIPGSAAPPPARSRYGITIGQR